MDGKYTDLRKIREVYKHNEGQENEYYQYLIGDEWYHQDYVYPDSYVAIRFKGFKNGNIHINFKKEIMDALTVEFARLKGWIKSPKEASEEMGVDIKTAQSAFNALRLDTTGIKLLGL